ncbi:unnamed protein product [Cuscuta campestris]|uniref:Uncharacterized protein n=1 Tax=Cuscuta campestris TaxID=132261 RepID=A0A484KZP5_9ASTE|nr:unnamed protein product [Cuscuta campestris]
MALPDEDSFPSPLPSFCLESIMKRAQEMEEERQLGVAGAATSRLIDVINNDRKRALTKTTGSLEPPNKKVKHSDNKGDFTSYMILTIRVMVARMKDRADFSCRADEEAAFNCFFSAFRLQFSW